MYDYSRLPTLVLNEIFGYLSVKERVKAKSVCRAWKEEIELREAKSDILVLHLGPYPWNMRWSETNKRRLMKFENSFQVKHLSTREPLASVLLKKTKKLAIVDFYHVFSEETSNLQAFLGHFKYCEIEEIEIRSFLKLGGTPLTFDHPKLKVLVIKDVLIQKLVLNCPSLEVLFWNRKLQEIHFQTPKKLKRLTCFGWPATLNGKFDALQYLNLFPDHDERVSDRLLACMPKLKQFVLYSSDPQADLEIIRNQQKLLQGLADLEILFAGFRDPVQIALGYETTGSVILTQSVDQLFENYSKLVENSPWAVWIDYSKLFNKFKFLPSTFFERFPEPYSIKISEVTNYTHLLGFLKCFPFLQQMRLHFSKVKADHILQLMHSLQPSLTSLTIVVESSLDLLDLLEIDLSFMRLFNLFRLSLEAPHLPFEFLRKVNAKRGPHLYAIMFIEKITYHQMMICYNAPGFFLLDTSCRMETPTFSSLEQLISAVQKQPHLKSFFF